MAAHIPEGAQSAPLIVFGGLVTNARPESLPEGASPICHDVDFITGSVRTRPGLSSNYQFIEGGGWGVAWGQAWG